MKFVKIALYFFLIVAAAFLIAGLFAPKDLNIQREITINKPKTDVFEFVKLLKNQDKFSVWTQMDPQMKKSFAGTDGEVGATSSWIGEKMGIGAQEIKGIKNGQRIDYELRFKTPMEATNTAFMTTDSVASNQTKVTWGFSSHSDYPMNVTNLFTKGMLEDQLQTGLNNLKNILDKK